jgi:hypothetical protein
MENEYLEWINFLIKELYKHKDLDSAKEILTNILSIKESKDFNDNNIKLIRKMIAYIQINNGINLPTYSQWFKYFKD